MVEEGDGEDMMLRLCVMNEENNPGEVGALIHQPNVDLSSVSQALGISRYSQIPNIFGTNI